MNSFYSWNSLGIAGKKSLQETIYESSTRSYKEDLSKTLESEPRDELMVQSKKGFRYVVNRKGQSLEKCEVLIMK